MVPEYTILSLVSDSEAHVRLQHAGDDAGSVWELHIYTLAAYARQRGQGAHDGRAPDTARQTIHVVDGDSGQRSVSVALAVPVIDEPVVRKTVIMVRKYKRLAPGLHQWGPGIPLDHAP